MNNEVEMLASELQDWYDDNVERVAKECGVSNAAAEDIIFLRTCRGRWTQAAEDELIRMDKAGESRPNIMEWP